MRTSAAIVVSVGLAGSVAAQENELRLGAMSIGTRRNIMVDSQSFARTNGTQTGAEFVFRGRGVGLAFRYAKGNYSPGVSISGYRNLAVAEGRLLMGPRPFTVELGYSRRSRETALFGDEGDHLVLGGARSHIDLGPSGFAVVVAGGAMVRVASDTVDAVTSSTKVGVAGWTLETGLLYQAPRNLPFFGLIGYRFERFKTGVRSGGLGGIREELSGIVLQAGIRWLRE
jgi:hypothetical protein